LFREASLFNGDLSTWDVSSVLSLYTMFSSSAFSGDVSSWDVSRVTDMQGLFEQTPFDGELSSWDVSSVISMHKMFKDSSFSKTICWNDISLADTSKMFQNSVGGSVRTDCLQCVTGTYRVDPDTCDPCPEGTYAPIPPYGVSGAVECLPCPIGSSNAATGQGSCFLCNVGTFQPGTGQSSCLPCPGGFFGPAVGQASCNDACSSGMYSTGGASSCFSFTTETLRTAVGAWCGGDHTTYGHISEWKTGGVTDMSGLFAPSAVFIGPFHLSRVGYCGDGSSNDFNEDVSKWDGNTCCASPFLVTFLLKF
jgi:surface protein